MDKKTKTTLKSWRLPDDLLKRIDRVVRFDPIIPSGLDRNRTTWLRLVLTQAVERAESQKALR